MAENDSMEGKNFELSESIKIILNNTKDQEVYIETKIKGLFIRATRKVNDDEYELYLGLNEMEEKIGTVTKNKEIVWDIEGLKSIEKTLTNAKRPAIKYEDLGLPDIEYLEYLERNQKLQEEQGKEKQGEEAKEKPGDEEQDQEEEKLEEEAQEESKGLLKLNLAVLELINPELRGCTAVYLNPRTNSLVIKDKSGKEHSPEEFGFEEKRVEGGNFALSKMNEEGEISSRENPTKLYAIKGSDYAITTDFRPHHREANIAVKGRDENHGNSYSIIKGNLTKEDSGDISKHQGQERAATTEGRDAGEQGKTNEKVEEMLKNLNSDDKKKFQQGFADKASNENRMNDLEDLKEVVTEILIKDYGVNPDNASKIAYGMVYKNKTMEDYGIKPKGREPKEGEEGKVEEGEVEEALVPWEKNRPK